MNIHSHIQKVSQIPYTDDKSLFIRQREPRTSKRNRKTNTYKPQPNINLYTEDSDDDENYSNESQNNCLPENEIECSIKEANGGICYSNESIEKHFMARQIETSSNSNATILENDMFSFKTSKCKTSTAKDNNSHTTSSHIKSSEGHNFEDEESILKMCKLDKNAAIRGLLKNHKITLRDLQIPVGSIDKEYKSNINIENENVPLPSDCNERNYIMKLVQHPDDPEVFVQPLQAYGNIDENKYKNIDFTVPHIGKKRTITPRQFYTKVDDSVFDFVKKDITRKK